MEIRTFSLAEELRGLYEFYQNNGFLVVEKIFTFRECDDIVAIFEQYARPDHRGIMNLDRGFIEYEEVIDGKEIIEIIEVDSKDSAAVWSVMRCPSVVTILDILQRGEIMALQSMFLFKKVGTRYATQAWWPHQDNAYPLADYGLYITGNIALADQDPENGGMYIYPGSHKEAILHNVKMKSFQESEGENPGHRVEVPEKYLNSKSNLIMKKGSVLFLHGNVIHGSYPNLSKDRSRPMFSTPYGTKGITQGKIFLPGRKGKRREMSLR